MDAYHGLERYDRSSVPLILNTDLIRSESVKRVINSNFEREVRFESSVAM